MDKIKKLFNDFGWKKISTLPFYPVLMIFTNPYAFICTIKNYFNLKKSELRFYTGTNLTIALNIYVYYVQYLNILKFGRYGRSRLLAGGDYDLRTQFNFNPFSLKIMFSLGVCFFLFISMFLWFTSVILAGEGPVLYSIVLILIILFSTLFYANFFDLQNYNMAGWIFLPLAVKSLIDGNYLLIVIWSLLAAIGSSTAAVVIFLLAIVTSFYCSDLLLMFVAVVPPLTIYLKPLLKSLKAEGFSKLSRSIGLNRNSKYKYCSNISWVFTTYYILVLWGLFVFVYYLLFGNSLISFLILLPVILFWINESLFRFTDVHSLFMVYLTVAAVAMFNTRPNVLLVIVFFLSINPMYGFLSFRPRGNLFFNPPVRKPINTRAVLDSLVDFLRTIPAGSRIFMSFHNPENQYWKIFDGHRIFIEPLEYVAVKKDVIVFPDWYFIYENNYKDSPEDFWGTEPEKVSRIIDSHKADYVLIYQTDKILSSKWSENGFVPVSSLKWKPLLNKLNIGYETDELYWWILQKQKL